MLRSFGVVVVCAVVLRKLQKWSLVSARRKANQGRSIPSPDETGAHAFFTTNRKGIQLYCRRWGSFVNANAAVILLHTELLNGSFFRNIAEKLSSRGVVSYAVDLTGFGKSGCQQGVQSHIESYTDYLDDVDAVIDVAKCETDNCPVFLCGEGLGGTIALAYSLSAEYAGKVNEVVVSAPKLQPSMPTASVENSFYRFMEKIKPTAMGPRESTEEDIVALFDIEEVGLTARDNFDRLQPATIKKIKEIAALCEYVYINMERIALPLFIVHGEEDRRYPLKMSEELKNNVASSTAYLRTYNNVKHGLLYGNPAAERGPVGDVVGFLVRNFPKTDP